jgi:hypothetical protein
MRFEFLDGVDAIARENHALAQFFQQFPGCVTNAFVIVRN